MIWSRVPEAQPLTYSLTDEPVEDKLRSGCPNFNIVQETWQQWRKKRKPSALTISNIWATSNLIAPQNFPWIYSYYYQQEIPLIFPVTAISKFGVHSQPGLS